MDVTPANERFQIRFFARDQELIDWWKKQPKRMRSANLQTIIKRGLGASDEEIDSLRDFAAEINHRLSATETFLEMTANAVNTLNERLTNAEENLEPVYSELEEYRNLTQSLIELANELKAHVPEDLNTD